MAHPYTQHAYQLEIIKTHSGLGAYDLQSICALRRKVWPCQTSLIMLVDITNSKL